MHHHFFVSYSFIVFMTSSKQLVFLLSECGIIFYVFLPPFGGKKKKKSIANLWQIRYFHVSSALFPHPALP